MRISDWSSDVCSSDLPHPKRWLGTVQATYAGDKSSKAISRPACLYTAAPAETMWGVRLIKWPESGRPRCAGYGRREVRRAGQHYVDPTCWRKGFGPRPSAPASRATQAWVRPPRARGSTEERRVGQGVGGTGKTRWAAD